MVKHLLHTQAKEKLRLSGVTKTYGSAVALRDTTLSVNDGDFVTILGPSGSGKTTLLQLIAGFQQLSNGEMWLDGREISHLYPKDRNIGMVFQSYALFPHLTVFDNVAYPLRLRRWSRKDIRSRVEEMLSMVNLGAYGGRFPKELSGGQQQRVAIARALSFRPGVLLMDEPLGALDHALRIHMIAELRAMHDRLGNTVLYVTHDREEALMLSDTVIIMRDGRVVAHDTSQQLYTKPDSPFVATFFGDHNVVPVTRVGRSEADGRILVDCLGSTLTVAAARGVGRSDSDIGLVIPKAALELAVDNTTDARTAAIVRSVVYQGDAVEADCEVTGEGRKDIVKAKFATSRSASLQLGSSVSLHVIEEMCRAVCFEQADGSQPATK